MKVQPGGGPSRDLLRYCEIFANLGLKLYQISSQSCNHDVSVGGGAGGDSPRPKKKSEIRSLLDATGGTTATADNNKPQWMMFRAQVDRYIDTHNISKQCISLYLHCILLQNHVGSAAATGGVDNPAFERQDRSAHLASCVTCGWMKCRYLDISTFTAITAGRARVARCCRGSARTRTRCPCT